MQRNVHFVIIMMSNCELNLLYLKERFRLRFLLFSGGGVSALCSALDGLVLTRIGCVSYKV